MRPDRSFWSRWPRVACLGLVIVGSVVLWLRWPIVPEGPDILLVTIDGVRAADLGFAGSLPGTTLHLESLVRGRGRVDLDCTAESPSTLVTHATIWTGLPQEVHGVRGPTQRLSARLPRLPTRLQEKGYRTAAVVSSPLLDRTFGLENGFELYENLLPLPEGDVETGNGHRVESGASLPAEVTGRALAWLEGVSRSRPFFLHVHYGLRPGEPRGGERVVQVDRELGRIFRWLREQERFTGALIVVTGCPDPFVPGSAEGRWAESVLDVPLLLALPRGEDGEGTVGLGPTGTLDIAPTILAVAGIDSDLPGIDLRRLREPGRLFLSEGPGLGRLLKQGRWCVRAARPEGNWALHELPSGETAWRERSSESPNRLEALRGLERQYRHELAIFREEHYPGLDPEHPTFRDPRRVLRGIGYLR